MLKELGETTLNLIDRVSRLYKELASLSDSHLCQLREIKNKTGYWSQQIEHYNSTPLPKNESELTKIESALTKHSSQVSKMEEKLDYLMFQIIKKSEEVEKIAEKVPEAVDRLNKKVQEVVALDPVLQEEAGELIAKVQAALDNGAEDCRKWSEKFSKLQALYGELYDVEL